MARKDPAEHKYYDRFDLLLVVSVVTVVLLLLVDLDQGQGLGELLSVTVTILTAAMLMLAVTASGVGHRGRRLAWIAVALTVSGSIIGAFLPSSIEAHGGLLWLGLVVAAPVVTLRRLMHHPKVTLETMLGGVSVYFLMAIASTYLFLFIDISGFAAGGFFGSSQPTTVFMYFSLVTITTVGYGDFAPAEVVGRAAAGLEAIMGQVYLVVVVAYIVALFTANRAGMRDPALSDDD